MIYLYMIICHIVGINNKLKKSFITDIDNISDKLMILDLDDLSKKIMFDKEYSKLYDQYNIKKDRETLTMLGQIWKIKFTNDINLLLDHNQDKYIILIGLITFYLDYRIKINLNETLNDKFFVNINIEQYIKDMIEYNIDNFKSDIINSKFPLKYLEYDFIKSQRENLREQYMIRDYKLKTYDTIVNWIKHKFLNIEKELKHDIVYVASFKRYDEKIHNIADTIVGYTDKWLAMISILPKNTLKRGIGYKNNKIIPIIKELTPNGFSELNKCCYIYELYPDKKVDDFRYLISDNNFINRYYVSNIKNELNLYNPLYQRYIID